MLSSRGLNAASRRVHVLLRLLLSVHAGSEGGSGGSGRAGAGEASGGVAAHAGSRRPVESGGLALVHLPVRRRPAGGGNGAISARCRDPAAQP